MTTLIQKLKQLTVVCVCITLIGVCISWYVFPINLKHQNYVTVNGVPTRIDPVTGQKEIWVGPGEPH